MTLRAKLILAFLFLAAVPLVVVTVYSYASSVDALRRTVERESGAVAEQMGERMELVAEDLDRRVEGLGRLPFGSLAATSGAALSQSAHLEIFPLGGLGEFGLNLMVYRHGSDCLVVDAGMMFPGEEHPGAHRTP